MATKKLRFVICESVGDDYGHATFPPNVDVAKHQRLYGTRRKLWAAAKAAGWRRDLGFTYCPGCAQMYPCRDQAKG